MKVAVLLKCFCTQHHSSVCFATNILDRADAELEPSHFQGVDKMIELVVLDINPRISSLIDYSESFVLSSFISYCSYYSFFHTHNKLPTAINAH